jgi:hypothetical protein
VSHDSVGDNPRNEYINKNTLFRENTMQLNTTQVKWDLSIGVKRRYARHFAPLSLHFQKKSVFKKGNIITKNYKRLKIILLSCIL